VARDWISLLNAKGEVIVDQRHDKADLSSGSIVRFPSHIVHVGACVLPPEVRPPGPQPSSVASSISVHTALEMGLDFSAGDLFKAQVKRKFRSTVHPLGKANHFLMTVSFGRAKFKLDKIFVGLALESCLGGLCDDMLVIQLADRVFRFSVASRHVGFMIYAMKFFTCASFKCFFHLWGNGGPLWKSEFRSWQKECNEEWILVSPNKKRTDHGMSLLQKRPNRSALKSPASGASVKRKLSYATFIEYPLCQGYEYEASDDLVHDVIEAGYDCPQIRRRARVILSPSIIRSDHHIQFGTADSNLVDQIQSETALENQEPSETPQKSTDDGLDGLNDDDPFGINYLVDDMAYRVWKCG
jgi:hypothetical protein